MDFLLSLVARYLGVTFVANAQQAADLGYVHPGDDRRLAGDFGRALATVQRELSFKSDVDVLVRSQHNFNGTLVEVGIVPHGRWYVAIAVPRSDGRWDTVRFGWLRDHLWGDAGTLGYNPEPETVGGYILDVRIKLRSTTSFIELLEQAA